VYFCISISISISFIILNTTSLELKEKIAILNSNNIFPSYLKLEDVSDNIDDNIQLITNRTNKIFDEDFDIVWKTK